MVAKKHHIAPIGQQFEYWTVSGMAIFDGLSTLNVPTVAGKKRSSFESRTGAEQMSKDATLTFDCPECGASNHVYLNVSAMRRKGENSLRCTGCGRTIDIQIDILVDEN